MLSFSCNPNPDELFYSIYGRHGAMMQYTLEGAIFQELFNSTRPVISTLLAQRLEYFVQVLPPADPPYTVEYFIDNHTLLPFFAPFLPITRVERIREDMAKGGHFATPVGLGINRRRIKLPDWLRFCPKCVNGGKGIEFLPEPKKDVVADYLI